MATPTAKQAIQHVHRPHGQTDRTLACPPPDPEFARVPSIADLVPVTQIMTREISCARPDLEVDRLADLVVREHIGCVPIVNELGGPTGMVTKSDLVELLATSDARAPRTARELMMPLAITLGARATVAHAAALMALEDVHHIPIVDDDGCLIGIVSSMDIVRWLAANDGFTHAR
jgi:CBS domain-containing protein